MVSNVSKQVQNPSMMFCPDACSFVDDSRLAYHLKHISFGEML